MAHFIIILFRLFIYFERKKKISALGRYKNDVSKNVSPIHLVLRAQRQVVKTECGGRWKYHINTVLFFFFFNNQPIRIPVRLIPFIKMTKVPGNGLDRKAAFYCRLHCQGI